MTINKKIEASNNSPFEEKEFFSGKKNFFIPFQDYSIDPNIDVLDGEIEIIAKNALGFEDLRKVGNPISESEKAYFKFLKLI